MNNGNELEQVASVDVESTKAVSALLDRRAVNVDEIVAKAAAIAEAIDKIAALALRLTEPRHWVAMKEKDGKSSPWLTGPGAEMMIAKLALRVDYEGSGFTVDRFEFEDGGKKITRLMMTCKLRVSIADWSSIVAEGHCMSNDAFFSKGGRLPAHQVDLGNMRQASYTNALSNAVTRLLGIRRLTWAQVKSLTGGKVDETKVDKAEFTRGGQGGASRADEARTATNEQRTAVWLAWCEGMGVNPKDLPPGIADTFYAWVVRHLGEEKRDKKRWTEADCKKLGDECKLLNMTEVPDAPEAENEQKQNDEDALPE